MEKLGRVQKGTQLGQRLRGITQPGHTTSYQIIEGVSTQERGGGMGEMVGKREGSGEENCSDLKHWRLGLLRGKQEEGWSSRRC